jgi:hypothetical protein
MRRLAILAMATAVLAAPSHSAAAEPAPRLAELPGSEVLSHLKSAIPPAKTFRSGLRLEARGGYEVEVTTSGSAVFLIVSRGRFGKRFVGTAYLTRGLSAPERMQATFGKFGRVSMRFRESPNKTWIGKRRNCRNKQRFVKRRGVFVGKLRFEGEGGYIKLNVRRAKGSVVTVARKCLRQRRRQFPVAQESNHLSRLSLLIALARDGVDFTGFLVAEGRRTMFLATHEEARPKLALLRIAQVRNRMNALRPNETLTRARVSAPAPFHGAGRYKAAPDGTVTWSGNLSVNFPGAPRFPLTGPGFETLLETPF